MFTREDEPILMSIFFFSGLVQLPTRLQLVSFSWCVVGVALVFVFCLVRISRLVVFKLFVTFGGLPGSH